MSLEIGIVGLPNVGKSTLFNTLTNNDVLVANYPFATIEPNTGTVPVPDERLMRLGELYDTKKIIPSTVNFVDIAGLIAGSSIGEGLGNQFLSNIRSCKAIIHLVRSFSDSNITHVNNRISPKEDIEVINTELVLSDLQIVNNHLPRLEKEAKINHKLKANLENLQRAQKILNDNMFVSSDENIDLGLLHDLQLITVMPVIYVFNVDETTLNDEGKKAILRRIVNNSPALFICAKLEYELNSLSESDKQELLLSYGQEESGLVQLVHSAYRILNLQSFLTAGEKEVRAWTITSGSTAPQAAGVIHTDFEKGFIAAEIVDYNDLLEFGSLSKTRAGGKMRTEGKTYVMQPDDVVEFRFNV